MIVLLFSYVDGCLCLCVCVCVWNSSALLNRSGKSGNPGLFPGLIRKTFSNHLYESSYRIKDYSPLFLVCGMLFPPDYGV